ncbi:MAG: DUF3784 domain-containing protein [Psychroserpens sp.]|uniref:DUF3784 domain-containing protein n=1 Tax=Psychroserpens sp. TaxID=2020870 RepID=UPI003C71BAFE
MSIIIALLFIAIGYVIKYLKLYGLIAGYNTMTDEEQAEYNIKKIGNLFGFVFFGMAGCILLGYIASLVLDNPEIEVYVISIAVTIGLPYLIFRSNSKGYRTKGTKH